jgi:hypothetical protein
VSFVYGRSPQPSRRLGARWALLAAAFIAGLAALAYWVLQEPAADSSVPSAHPAAVQPTEESAVRIAVEALDRLTVLALLDRRAFEAAVSRYAAPAAVPRVRAAFGSADPRLLAAFVERPRALRGAPIGYRVERYSPRAVRVAVWTVAIAATPQFGVRVAWRTLTIDLAWTAAGWKVTGGAGRNGPDPAAPLRRFTSASARFKPLSDAR